MKKDFEISFCYVDTFSDEPFAGFSSSEEREFDVLLCWQVMPPRELLDRHFRFNRAAFFPMYDDCPLVKKVEKWWPYRDFHIICFSKELAYNLSQSGFSSKYIQYFPEPADRLVLGDAESAFLWFRRELIGIRLVERLFSKIGMKHLHVHNAPDPGNELLGSESEGSIRCTFSTWYDDRKEMIEEIASCSYYIAPREKEGIGMSFLEAMAMGKCVVAPDHATMNEYIEHGRTGLLYNLKKVKPFESVSIQSIQENTYQYMCEGYRRWVKERENIAGWLEEPARISKPKMVFSFVRRFFRNPVKVCRVIRNRHMWRMS